MKFKIGQFITVKSTNEKKVIVDREIINSVEIYYTTDNKSYSSTQITEYVETKTSYSQEQITNAYSSFLSQICNPKRS